MEKDNLFALAFRSAAVFIILFQIRLIAADLADTPVFTATLLAGFAAAVFLSVFRTDGKRISPLAAVVSIALIPWVGRLLVAMPRFFIPDRTDAPAIIFDSMLLNLDRNNFVSLFPYYWSAVTTFFAVRSRKFLRASVVADASLLIFIYSVARAGNIEIYRFPIVMIVLFAVVVFLQALALLFSMPPEIKLRVKEKLLAITALIVIIGTGGVLFIKPVQEQAAQMGGGLLEPKFFSYDFSKLLKLDPEISVKDDLILIVKKENDGHIFLRRSVLSGYSKKNGFYKIEELDEKTHPEKLPLSRIILAPPAFKDARFSAQEYFLVNAENDAFIGMKEPVLIIPYENWDASSFKAAYGVNSLVSDADIGDLYISTINWPEFSELGLSEDEFKIYTDYGKDEKIRFLAEEITGDCITYTEKVVTVYNYLKNGDYFYSLKPGIAPDGDQLGWFLFHSKKGYCSYYAFAMTLLLRSLGIPARLAAGFFVEQETNTLDYYPVRSDMAHAWVEVAFPGYGWIEFDPTTENLAEGEEFRFSAGVDPALFEKLMREILENRYSMKAKENIGDTEYISGSNSFAKKALVLLRNNRLPLLAFILIALSLYIRCGLYFSVLIARNPRKKSVRFFKHARRLLRLAGVRRRSDLAESEWAARINSVYNGIYSLYESAAAARFAPEFSKQELELQRVNYKIFRSSYNANVPLWRRITSWIFPLSVMPPGRLLTVLILIGLISGSQTSRRASQIVTAQESSQQISADALFKEASDADYSENWERAIELYKKGAKTFPDDGRFSWSLGNLYYGRSLYGLAWDEYKTVEKLAPNNAPVIIRLAKTAGYLNRNAESVSLYERVLEIEPNNMEAIGNLGWMYFKVHRLEDGEKLLVSAVNRLGYNTNLSMTLGSVYSDMYRYDESKNWYNNSIKLGEEKKDKEYTAIAWYNLSILESRFYRYDLCMDAIDSSLRKHNRASGHLAMGEILKRRLKLTETQKEYETAYETDTSPLSKLYLAQVYHMSGRLEEARLYAQDCLKDSNNSWMLHFGIDPDSYKRDIHLALADTYSGLLNTEYFLPKATLKDKISSLLKIVSYMIKKEVNLKLYRKYSLASANAYGATLNSSGGDNHDVHLDSLTQYYNAFKDYPRRAVTYLDKARTFETTLIPAAIPFYDHEEGILFNRKNLLEKALREFDPYWEREYIANCHKALKNEESLFALNRGAINQAGMKLPVHLDLFFEEDAKENKHLERALLKAGFKKEAITARFRLAVRIHGAKESGYTALCELVDTRGELETLRYSFPVREPTKAEYYKLAMSIRNRIFTVD